MVRVTLERKGVAVNTTRAYSSSLRQSQVRETRRRIILSAHDLFLEQGYAGTTMTAVARRAGVSQDTVYTRFGTKLALLKHVLEVAVGGDDEDLPVLDRAGPQALRAEPDPRRQVAMFATGMSARLERSRPFDDILRGAAAVDPAAADLRAYQQEQQRRDDMRTIVGWIATHGPLRTGLTESEAADTVWALTSPEVHGMLRDTSGWSRDRYEAWLRDTLLLTLLPLAA